MGIAIISDIHVKPGHSESYQVLLSFMQNDLVHSCSSIYFLGDIFDLLIGNYEEYYDLYKEFWEAFSKILKKGITIHYVEGNHDFHINKLFETYIDTEGLDNSLFKFHSGSFVEEIFEKKFFFSHGDDIGFSPRSYRLYKKIIRSKTLENLTNNRVVPYRFVDFVGKKASSSSRRRNRYKDQNVDIKHQVRESIFGAIMGPLKHKEMDFIIMGHSHEQDDFSFPGGVRYLNVGNPVLTKKFLYIENGKVVFEQL